MINNKDIIAFIPARGNSKSIRKKNLALLGSKPLIDYVIEAAKSFNFNKIVCSTEDKEIASHCLNKKIEVSVRDRSLSKDETNVVDVKFLFHLRFVCMATKLDDLYHILFKIVTSVRIVSLPQQS